LNWRDISKLYHAPIVLQAKGATGSQGMMVAAARPVGGNMDGDGTVDRFAGRNR
jgi:hypothetical protein